VDLSMITLQESMIKTIKCEWIYARQYSWFLIQIHSLFNIQIQTTIVHQCLHFKWFIISFKHIQESYSQHNQLVDLSNHQNVSS